MNSVMKNQTPTLIACILCGLSLVVSAEEAGKVLVFEDGFDRKESLALKDEPGNDWTTNSEARAKGNKQVFLRDGHVFIERHAEADHAATLNRSIDLKNGAVALKLKFSDVKDNIHLNFADPREKSVHAGHLFHISINPKRVMLTDLKFGQQNLEIRAAHQKKTLSEEQEALLASKSKRFGNELELGKWHEVLVTIEGDEICCTINGKLIGSFKSEGFAHPRKTKLRLHIAKSIHLDDVRVWKHGD